MATVDSESPERDPLEAVADAFLARLRAGEQPALSEYQRAHPELAHDIGELFPALLMMEAGRQCVEKPAEADPARLTEAQLPRQLGEYRLLRQIGRGGMGVVYEAWQESLGRHVALKILPFNQHARPEQVERFRRESRAAARLHHTNIVPVFGVGTDQGIHYYAMQFIHGHGLDVVLSEVRRLRGLPGAAPGAAASPATAIATQLLSAAADVDTPATPVRQAPSSVDSGTLSGLELRQESGYFTSVARVGLQVAEALEYAHGQGVLHRDIKPSNLLLDAEGRVWISDFGLAKAEDSEVLTDPGDVLGTVRYMAPERFHGQTDARGDVYGLGITLYELLTLRPAFDQVNRVLLMEQIARSEPVRPRKLEARLPRDLETIVLKAIAKETEQRYHSAGVLAEDLRRFLADRPIRARRASWRERGWRWCRRNPVVATLAATVMALLLVISAGLGWLARDRSAQRAETVRQVQQVVTLARGLVQDNRLPEARRELAKARGVLDAAGAEPAGLAAEVNALETEVERAQRFFELIDQAHRAEFVDSKWQYAPAVPIVLEALACYGIMDQEDWRDRLGGGVLSGRQVQQIRHTAYEELLWLAAYLLGAPSSDVPQPPASRARQALAYLEKAATAREPTFALYHLRARCRQALGDKPAARADEELAGKTPPMLAVDHYLRGHGALLMRDCSEGINAFERALTAEPTHYWSMMRLGYCFCDLGRGREDFTAASLAFTACIMNRPVHAHAYYCRGLAFYKLGRLQEALADYSRAVELDPNDHLPWSERGIVHNVLKQREKALTDYSTALRLQPKYARAWYNRGLCYSNAKQWEQALADLSTAVALDPNYVYALSARGYVYGMLRQSENALADLARAIELNRKHVPAWRNRGDLYRRLGQWQKALADYNRAIELNPRHMKVLCNRAAVYSQLKQWSEALADLSAAIDLEPKSAVPWYNRGIVHGSLGKLKEALADYSTAIDLDSKHTYAWNNRASLYLRLGKTQEALADASQAVHLDPKLYQAWFTRGAAHSRLGRWEEAIQDFSRVTELDKKGTPAWLNRALAHAQVKKWREALADYSKVIELDSRSAIARHGRAYCHSVLGAWDKAAADVIHLKPPSAAPGDAWFDLACLYLLADDRRRYKELCKELLENIERSRQGFSGHGAYLAARTCLLAPEADADREKVARWAESAVSRQPKRWSYLHVLALAHYRAGRFPAALRHAGQAEQADPRGSGSVLSWLVRALAHQTLGQDAEAGKWLDKASRWRAAFDAGQPVNPSPPQMLLSDWLEFQVLYRQAQEMLAKAARGSS